MKDALVNQMILILFDDDDLIIILSLDELHELNLFFREESQGAMLQSFMIVHVHTATQMHRNFMGMKRTLRCTMAL